MRIALPLASAAALTLGLAAVDLPAKTARALPDCARTSTGLVPLTDLGRRNYRGYRGGLYPSVRNRPSPSYLRQGLAAAKRVKPIDGQIVLLSIGMSITTQEFSTFKRAADADPVKNPNLVIIDGALSGWDASKVKRPAAEYWRLVEERLAAAQATPQQVQVIWLKEAIAGEDRPFPRDARALQADLRAIVRIARTRFPNLRLVYLSSRTYAGYAVTGLNPEPAAYDGAFAIRWLISERMKPKKNKEPWLGWGPYLWTDGTKGRGDGLAWLCEDVGADGTHPSKTGAQKVSQLLLQFFKADATAKPWFRAKRPPPTS